MSRIIRLAAVAAVLFAAPAMAQNVFIQSHAGSAPGAKGDIRVNVGMSFFVVAPTDDSEAAIKAQEQARRVIYESAARECEVLRAAIASESASRTRSCAGLPMTVWSTSRTWMASLPLLLATGPRFPTWQSPQVHVAGPSGSEARDELSSQS